MRSETRQGSLLGGILLVAGCCIGAGMLGLPVLSAQAGFVPSLLIFFSCWLYMLSTGLLLTEVNLWFEKESSLTSMAERCLGPLGKWTAWSVFLFLFYSLMVAYVSASGSLLSDFSEQISGVALPRGVASTLVTFLFGGLIARGIGAVDGFNRFLMGGLFLSYLALLFIGSSSIEPTRLEKMDWHAAPLVIPAVIVSFGFHNLIPTLTRYYHQKRSVITTVLVLGSLIPLVVYIVWQALILGIVSPEQFQASLDSGEIATHALASSVGSPWVIQAAQLFSFFAITTSFLSVAIGFVDFLTDAFQTFFQWIPSKEKLIALALLPPLLFAAFYPDLFLIALKYAGGYGAIILFGLLPVFMVWRGRSIGLNQTKPALLPGGAFSLLLVGLVSLGIILLQLVS